MKIVMATHYFPSHHGGIEIVADRIFRAFATGGHRIIWIAGAPTAPPDPIDAGHAIGLFVFNFVEERFGVPVPIPTFGAIRRIRAEVYRADAVILHDCLYLTNIAAFIFAKLCGVPIAIVQHVGLIPYKNLLLRYLMKLANLAVTCHMLSRADQVIFVGEATQQYFRRLEFKNPPELVLNGVETDLYRPVETRKEKAAIRLKYGLPTDRPVILFVGRLVESKGISIIRKMAKERPEWIWALAGRKGPTNPSDWNVANVRVFLGPPDAILAELYRASDLFVLPSKYEAFSIVVREALMSGLPVVCTSDVLKSDPEIEPYIEGVCIHPDDKRTADAFLNAIERLLSLETAMITKSRERYNFAALRYSWDRATERYIEIASRLIRESRIRKPHNAMNDAEAEES